MNLRRGEYKFPNPYFKIVGDAISALSWEKQVLEPYMAPLVWAMYKGLQTSKTSKVVSVEKSPGRDFIRLKRLEKGHELILFSNEFEHSLTVRSWTTTAIYRKHSEVYSNLQAPKWMEVEICSENFVNPSLPTEEELDFMKIIQPEFEDLMFEIRDEFGPVIATLRSRAKKGTLNVKEGPEF